MKRPRLALISLQNTTIDFGIRYVASATRSAGCDVEVLWICMDPGHPLPDSGIDAAVDWIRSNRFDLAGIGLMSIHFSRAAELTHAIQNRAHIPVIWGGIHPILAPEQCLEHADYVCVGDGETAVPSLLKALDQGHTDPEIENIWYSRNGTIIRTPRSVIDDLDAFPAPDYDLQTHFLLANSRILPGTETGFRERMPWSHLRHYVISSRGCPHQCTYCSNSALREIFGKKHSMRFRSVENLMNEIRAVKTQFPFIRAFAIMDDSFFFKPQGWIEEFCAAFREVDAGFGVLIHPKTVTRPRMEMLIDAGLMGVQMGLQSGSERTNREIYRRPEPVSEFIRAAGVLDEFMDRLMVRTYDVIVDNPLEEDTDREETVRVLSYLNKPFHLDLFSLTLYPGTVLHDLALAGPASAVGDMSAEDKNYLQVQPTILNRLTWLTHTTPGFLIRFFLKHRRHRWCRLLFRLYDRCWERMVRPLLRAVKRQSLRWLAGKLHRNEHREVIMRGKTS
ncbi:MAG TPA: radical SAM protein [bacterium]|nr:radical SAM protein [bacterium]